MRLVIGGAFQGKREFAKRTFGLREEDIREPEEPGAAPPAIDRYQEAIRRQLELGMDPQRELERLLGSWPEVVLICDEVGCGVVPMEERERAYREAVGRTMCLAASRAREVWRVFCGIGTRIA